MIDRASRATNPAAYLALGCVGFIASAGHAQQVTGGAGDGPTELEGVTVTDSDGPEAGYQVREAIGPKNVAPLIDTPRSVVVIPQQLIKDTGSVSLVDALRTVPGITFGAAEGGNPLGDRPFIRGFDAQGSTFLDGVRDIGAQSREVFAVEQIQVVRGSDSTLGGRGTAGGAINIVSKTPRAGDFAEADLSLGNASYRRATADVNLELAPHIAFRVEGLFHRQDVAGRDAVFQHRWGVAPSLTIGIDTPTRLLIGYYHLDGDELPDSGLPYLYTLANAPPGETRVAPVHGQVTTIGGQTGHVGRDTFYGLKDRDFRDTKTDQATMRVEHDFGRLTLRNTTRYDHTTQNYSYTQPDDSQGNVFGTAAVNPGDAAGSILTGGYVWRRSNNRYGFADALVNQTDLFGSFDTFGLKHSIAVGAEVSWEKARRGTYNVATGSTVSPRCNASTIARYYCTSLFDPNPNDPWINYASDTSNVAVPITRNSFKLETENEASTIGVYGFDSITVTDFLIVNLGLRHDRFRSQQTPGQALAVTTPQPTFRRTDHITDYQAGVVLKPTHNTSLYASYATASTPPNSLIGEGRDPNGLPTNNITAGQLQLLKVERTRSWEAGAKADILDERLSLTLAAFQTRTKNARVTGEDGNPQFIGETRSRGVEVGFNGQLTPWWSVFGGYSYLDSEITDGGFTALTVAANGTAAATSVRVPSVNNGRQAPQVAKNSVTIWTDVKPLARLSVGGGAFYQSRVFGGYQDNRSASQTADGVITIRPATKLIERSAPGYWRFDARAGFEINDRLGLSVNVQNLTNKCYFSQVYTSHYAAVAPGRTAFATLSVKY